MQVSGMAGARPAGATTPGYSIQVLKQQKSELRNKLNEIKSRPAETEAEKKKAQQQIKKLEKQIKAIEARIKKLQKAQGQARAEKAAERRKDTERPRQREINGRYVDKLA